MKKILIPIFILIAFISLSCNKTNPVGTSLSNKSSSAIKIGFSMKDVPANVASVVGILSRQGYDTLKSQFVISNDTAQCEFDNIVAGTWHLQVNAYDGTNALKYSGGKDVQVVGGEITSVNLVLNPTTGSISVTVTWGNSGTAPNKSLVFDGSSGYVDVADSPSLTNIDSAYTLEAWIKPTGNTQYNYIIAKGAPNLQYTMELLNSQFNPAFTLNGVTIDFTGASEYWSRLVLLNTLQTGVWTHLAITYKSGEGINVYINGNLAHHASASGLLTHVSGDLRLGVLLNDTYQLYFKGLMDDVRIWKTALTADQIKSSMNVELSGTESNLVAYWNFDDSIGSTVASDKSSFGNDGKLMGGVTFSVDTPF